MKRLRTLGLVIAADVCLLALVVGVAGCGKKGPPLAPLRLVPAGVEGVRATRQGDTVRVALTLPRANTDETTPADLDHVLVYAITGDPVGPGNARLTAEEWAQFGTLVGRIDVRPPPVEGEEPAAVAAAVTDQRPVQGASVTLTETLDARAQTRFIHPGTVAAGGEAGRGSADPKAQQAVRPGSPQAVQPGAPPVLRSRSPMAPADEAARAPRTSGAYEGWPLRERMLQRFYVAIPVSRRNQVGAVSPAAAVPLAATPPAASAPEVAYTARAFRLTWELPAGLRLPIQRPVTPEMKKEGWLSARPAVRTLPPHAFAVYELPNPEAPPDQARLLSVTPISPTDPEYEESRLRFGQERCFAVRTIQAFPTGTLESPLSPATCVTPEDTFPPEPPSNLTSVGSEGGVSLIWEASPDADLAGYLVLRGEAGQPLDPITPAPIRETTYRDTTARPNVPYVYAVVAIDAGGNRSEASNQVEDMAR